MKPLLYIGAALMLGAGIYGFVDYKNTKQSRKFQSLYREEQKKEVQGPVAIKAAPAAVPASVVTEKKETAVVEKRTVANRKPVVKKKNKKFAPRQFSRAALKDEVLLPEPEIKVEQ